MAQTNNVVHVIILAQHVQVQDPDNALRALQNIERLLLENVNVEMVTIVMVILITNNACLVIWDAQIVKTMDINVLVVIMHYIL